MKWLFGILLIPGIGSATNLYPHPGVHFLVTKNVPIYSVNKLTTPLRRISSEMAILPCVFLQKNGLPLTGPKGEVLVGIQHKIYVSHPPKVDESMSFDDLRQAARTMISQRREHFAQLANVINQTPKKVENLNCTADVTEALPLATLSPSRTGILKVNPAPSMWAKAPEALLQPQSDYPFKIPDLKLSPTQSLLYEFHNSKYCLAAELQFGHRKTSYLRAWKHFYESKLKSAADPKRMRANLNRSMEVDIMARTAMFEGDLKRGCSASGVCEKNVILLSLRNRARSTAYCTKNSEQYPPGVCVAIPEDQYNIWSELYGDRSHLTSCFLRVDREADTSPEQRAEWIDEDHRTQYRTLMALYKMTVHQTAQILIFNDEQLNQHFQVTDFPGQNAGRSAATLYNYYHPPAMPACYDNIPKAFVVPDAYIKCPASGGQFVHLPIRNEKIQVPGGLGKGEVPFTRLRPASTARLTFSAPELVPDELTYRGCVIDSRRVPPPAPPNPAKPCNPFGLPQFLADAILQGNAGGQPSRCGPPPEITYYRKVPKWKFTPDKTPQIACLQIEDRGGNCQQSPNPGQSHVIGGVCDRRMLPVLGGI